MKILLVEDESAVVSLIRRSLVEQGMEVSIAMDGNTGLEMATAHSFEVMILDIMLPGKNGIEVCRTLRKSGVTVPILMLTALDSTENVVTGLDAGADDYLAKPFKLTELLARIRALGRRKSRNALADDLLTFGGLTFNKSSKAVERNGIPITLTATEIKLLEFFLLNTNRVLSRMEILENVWDINSNLGTNVVDVYVNYLRKKIDRDYDTKLIHTLVGMGYMMKMQDK